MKDCCITVSPFLQCGQPYVFCIWKLSRPITLPSAGRHGVPLSAAQLHLSGIPCVHLLFRYKVFLAILLQTLTLVISKYWQSDQDPEPAGWHILWRALFYDNDWLTVCYHTYMITSQINKDMKCCFAFESKH